MKTTVKKKDDNFCAYVERSPKAMADYVAKRDEQINRIVENHNNAFRENSHAPQRLSDSIELESIGKFAKSAGKIKTTARTRRLPEKEKKRWKVI